MPARSVTARAAKVAIPGVVAVTVALTAAFGGFEKAPPLPPERYAPGQVIDQTLFHTQIMRAYIDQATTQKPGIPALHVELRVVNESDQNSYRDPLVTLGSVGATGDLWDEWKRSPTMLVYAGGKSRQLLSAEVRRPSGTDDVNCPPHIPVIVDTEWQMYRYHEKPGNIHVSVTGFYKTGGNFYDIPSYWAPITQPHTSKPTGGLQSAKPKMIATVHLPLSPSAFKPHPPVTKKKHKPAKKPGHHKHRKPS